MFRALILTAALISTAVFTIPAEAAARRGVGFRPGHAGVGFRPAVAPSLIHGWGDGRGHGYPPGPSYGPAYGDAVGTLRRSAVQPDGGIGFPSYYDPVYQFGGRCFPYMTVLWTDIGYQRVWTTACRTDKPG
jgi:hypothetical protein